MKCYIKHPVSLLLFTLLIGSAYFVRAQIPSTPTKLTSSGQLACDMKKKEKLPWCPKCEKVLMGYRCEGCAPTLTKEGTTAKPPCTKCKGLFEEKSLKEGKCPCCGSIKTYEAQLVNGDKCFFCNEPFKLVDFCVKKYWACPTHPDYKALQPGKCGAKVEGEQGKKKNCDQPLKFAETVYSKILIRYVCPKDGEQYQEAGKCLACNKVTTSKSICEESGNFPHVPANWEKVLKEENEKWANIEPIFKCFPGSRTPFYATCYVIGCPQKKEAAIIDPSGNDAPITQFLEENKLKLTHILLTHGHQDHMQGIHKFGNVPVYLFNGGGQGCKDIKDEEIIRVGTLKITVIHTPGHTQDSVYYHVYNILFTGDMTSRLSEFQNKIKELGLKYRMTCTGHAGSQ